MTAPRLEPERKIPKNLATFTELSKFISENSIKLFSREDHTKYDIINYHIEQNKNDEAFFIIDLGEILEQYKQWKTFFPNIKPFYAVKCCSNPMVLKTLAVLGCGFYCASKSELIRVTELNVPTNRILFGIPVKDPQHIRFARSQNIDSMTFDNEVELYKIKLYHPYAKLTLRISVEESTCGFGANAKFGCPMSEVKNLLEKARSLELDVVGVSFHIGNRNNDISLYSNAIEKAREVFTLGQEISMSMNILNIGGGFPGNSKHDLLTFEEIAKTVNEAIGKYFSDVEDLKVMAEPGRYFSTKSHVLVFNVIGKRKYVDENNETHFDYYMNEGVYGSFNSIVFDGAAPHIHPFNNNKNTVLYKSTVFGPTCDDMDVITRGTELPELQVGESLYVEDFGAYTQVSALDFNGFAITESNYVFRY